MENIKLQCAAGEDLQFSGNIQDALSLYESILLKSPNSEIALREKAFCLLSCDRIREARETLSILKSLQSPQLSEQRIPDFKTKFIEIKLIIRGDPSDEDSSHASAQSTMKKTRALQKFAHLLNNDEVRVIGSSDAWRLLVTGILAHLMMNKLKDSVELHEASYAVMPVKLRSHVALEIANLYHDFYLIEEEAELEAQLAISKSKCLAAAIAWFQKVAQDNPTETRGHLILSQIYLNQNDFELSTAECEKSLLLSESIKPIALLQKATIVLKKNADLKTALELMSEAHAIIVARQRMIESEHALLIEKDAAKTTTAVVVEAVETSEQINEEQKQSVSKDGVIIIPNQKKEETQQQTEENAKQRARFDSGVGLVLYQARNLSERGFINEAVQILEECLKDNQDNAAVYLELGHTYFLTGSAEDIPKSIDFYLKCYEVDKEFKDPAAAIALGAYYLEKVSEIQESQDQEDEEEDFLGENAKDNQTSNCNSKRNFEAEIKDACTKALNHFTKALELDTKKKCKKVHKSIATCYRLLNKLIMAVHSYEKELAEDEDDLDTLIEFASLLREMNNKKQGIAIIEKILLLDQHNEEAYETLCDFLEEKSDRIVAVLKRVFDKGDKQLDNIAQLIARTLVKFDKRQLFKQPEKWIENALAINSRNPETYFTQALLFLEKDLYQNALDWLARTLSIDPDHEECLETMLEVIHTHFEELKEVDVKNTLQVMKDNDEVWLRDRLEDSEYSRIKDLIQFNEDNQAEDLERNDSGEDGENQQDNNEEL